MDSDLKKQELINDLTNKLLIATKELSSQKREIKKQASELIIVNKELVLQSEEVEKQASELTVVKEELIFQKKEKIKRTVELVAKKKENFAQAELIRIQESYYSDQQLFEATLVSIGHAVISCDTQFNVIFINKVAEVLSGWNQEEAAGKPVDQVFNIVDELTREKKANIVEKAILSGEIVELEADTILICKDGTEKYIEDSTAPIFQKDGEIVGAVLVFNDVSDKTEKLRDIEFLSFHDELTGLYNRRFYEEELNRIDTERNLPITIAMGDLNGLKLINDSFGHKMGDEFLIKAAEAIKNGCRADDIIARVGGDEFMIILPKTNTYEASGIIERINHFLSEERVNGLEITISFGYQTKEEIGTNIETIYKNSEDAMYKQKLNESSSMRNKTVEIIMDTLYEKNFKEMQHSKRVGKICGAIAEKMRLGNANLHKMRLAGQMHDIGKIGIDENILNKIEKINEEEYNEIKRHSEIGFRILSSVNEFSEIANFILSHHERWDGKGYPKGLKGDEISIQARIIAVSEAYDAMISENSYKKALSQKEALEELERCSGTQFDPEVVKVFLEQVVKELKL